MFDNAWWRDKNTNRQPGGSLWDQTGAVAKGFGKHLATNLVPYEMGKKGIQARKGYNPMNLMNIGMMGLRSKNQYVPGRTATGAMTEYPAGFGDFMGNVSNDVMGQMMQQQKLKDMLLSRELMSAKIGKMRREAKAPIKPVQTVTKKGKIFETETTRWNPETQEYETTIDTAPRFEEKEPGTKKSSYTEQIGDHLYNIDVIRGPDGKDIIKKSLAPGQTGAVALPDSVVFYNKNQIANMPADKMDSRVEGDEDFSEGFSKKWKGIFQIPKMPTMVQKEKSSVDLYNTIMTSKKEIFELSEFNGQLISDPTKGGAAQFSDTGIYSRIQQLASKWELAGFSGKTDAIMQDLQSFFSVPHKEGARKELERLADRISVRAAKLALPSEVKLSSKMIDSQNEKRWLKDITVGEVKDWFNDPNKLRKNVARLERLERYAMQSKMGQLRFAQGRAKKTPWLRDEISKDPTFWTGPASQMGGSMHKNAFGPTR